MSIRASASIIRSAAMIAIVATCAMGFSPVANQVLVGPRAGLLTRVRASQHCGNLAMTSARDSENGLSRRAAASAILAAALGFPVVRASAMTEEEELKKLQEEAARLQGLFDSQRKANENIPGLKDGLKQKAEVGAKVNDALEAKPKPSSSGPEETVKTLMTALKNNKDDSGLQTVLDFTSPENPILENTKFFFNQMKNSKYNVLLGNFDKYEIVGTDKFNSDGKQVAIVQLKVTAPFKSMMINSVPSEYLLPTGEKSTSAVRINWQLSRDKASGNWLSDTMYFQPPPSSE